MLARACSLVLLATVALGQDVPADAYAAIGSDLVVKKQAVLELSTLTKRPQEQVLQELVRNAVIRHGLTARGVNVDEVDPEELEQVRGWWLAQGVTEEALDLLDLEVVLAFAAYARAQVEPAQARELYADYGWTLFGRVRARVIQLETNSVRSAEQATETLEALAAELGEDVDDATFAARAAKDSDGPFAAFERGDTEWFGARGVSALGSVIPRAIVEACLRQKRPGLIKTPLRGTHGVYLVRITAVVEPPEFDALTEVERTQVLDLAASRSARKRALLRDLHEEAHVRYSADAPGRP
ncbi:MAG: hypothetical protein KDD82_08115 [Planctomycetes bacterium]|nr:hypothetical protein [Planctomycetota bacterium]